MKPIKFKEFNFTYAEDQSEYLPLPVLKMKKGEVISCWKLTWKESWKLFWSRRIWFTVLTFNQPLQPQLPTVEKPFKKDKKK